LGDLICGFPYAMLLYNHFQDGWTALMLAASEGRPCSVRALLTRKDIDVNIQNNQVREAVGSIYFSVPVDVFGGSQCAIRFSTMVDNGRTLV